MNVLPPGVRRQVADQDVGLRGSCLEGQPREYDTFVRRFIASLVARTDPTHDAVSSGLCLDIIRG
jgi:hypothetical protein